MQGSDEAFTAFADEQVTTEMQAKFNILKDTLAVVSLWVAITGLFVYKKIFTCQLLVFSPIFAQNVLPIFISRRREPDFVFRFLPFALKNDL